MKKRITGIRFKEVGKLYYFDPMDLEPKKGDHAIVETARGVEYGDVVIGSKLIDEENIVHELKPIIRIANAQDDAHHANDLERAKEAWAICDEKIKAHSLEMNLVDVEYTFDGTKLLFYFTAEGRVDFRELVKDLAGVFKTRIELRQIGTRDECKMMSSVGVCGREICCSAFLGDFANVSIKMAKEQGLSLNPTKISGACGRLMCCLKYEQDVYEELSKEAPNQGDAVKTPQGKGIVTEVALMRGKVKVRIDESEAYNEFDISDVKVLHRGKRQNDTISKEDEAALKGLED